MFNLFSSSSKGRVLGVAFLPSGVAMVLMQNAGEKSGSIIAHGFVESVGQQAQTQALNDWVKSNGAEKVPCHCVLPQGEYDLLQIERPAVDEQEVANAIKWKIQDLIPYDIERAVIDYYPMPDSAKSHIQQINVAVANESVIGAYVDAIADAKITNSVIDISELVLKNMLEFSELSTGTFAVLVLNQQVGEIYIFKDSVLYVVRDFKIGIAQLETAENQESTFDSILLEVQRSVDYFESYFGLGGISKLYISPKMSELEKMANYLQNYVGFEIDFLSIDLVSQENVNVDFDYRCFTAYCAALRK